MEEVVNEIKETKTKIVAAESNGDTSRRNTLESYLVELQREKNLLLQQQAQAPGNYPILCISLSYFYRIFSMPVFYLLLMNFI